MKNVIAVNYGFMARCFGLPHLPLSTSFNSSCNMSKMTNSCGSTYKTTYHGFLYKSFYSQDI
jgi:hypothetical protein